MAVLGLLHVELYPVHYAQIPYYLSQKSKMS